MVGQPESGEVNFITTELQFFGHGDEVYFGYPQRYYDELAEAQDESAGYLQELAQKRQELIESGDTTSYYARQLIPEDSYQLIRENARADHIRHLKHRWYEFRFRNRYGDEEMELRHPEASRYLNWDAPSWFADTKPLHGPPPIKPSPEVIAAYLNDHIASNAWSQGVARAERWHKASDDDSPEKAVAAQYVGFLGSIVVHEYCRIAIALAADTLADDDFVSTKHFMTVCWPYVKFLEEYIPEEVKNTKQVLREVFLQMSLRGGGMRFEMERFGLLHEQNEMAAEARDRDEYENKAVSAVMRFEDIDAEERADYADKVFAASDLLVQTKQWARAADLLDLARRAFDLPADDIQQRIDHIVSAGVHELTADISNLYTEHLAGEDLYGYSFSTNNKLEVEELMSSPGVSREMKLKLHDMLESRTLEYYVLQYDAAIADPEADSFRAVGTLVNNFHTASPDKMQRFIDGEKIQAICDFYADYRITEASASVFDDLTINLLRLNNSGVLSREARNECLANMIDNLLSRIQQDPDYSNPFHRLMGILSPLARGSDKPDKPEDEVVWKIVSKNQIALVVDACRQREKMYPESREQDAHKYGELLLSNFRQAFSDYWDETEEYY